jgi:integration host factor subunit alpha
VTGASAHRRQAKKHDLFKGIDRSVSPTLRLTLWQDSVLGDRHFPISGNACQQGCSSGAGLAAGQGKAMADETITRADLSEAVYQKIGLSRTESAALVETVLGEISDCILRGENVKLSSFGSFIVRKKGLRVGRNPKTGVEVPIQPRLVMVFKPSNVMKARVNGLDAACEDD